MKLEFLDYKLVYEGSIYDPSYFLLDVWISDHVSIPIEFNQNFKGDSYSSFFSPKDIDDILQLAKPWLIKAQVDDETKMIDLVLGEKPRPKRKKMEDNKVEKSLKDRVAELEADIKMLKEIISFKLYIDFDKRAKKEDKDYESTED